VTPRKGSWTWYCWSNLFRRWFLNFQQL